MAAKALSPFPTLHTIAQQCGVSHVTVSRALRGQPNVHPETAARIRALAEELGYKSNTIARSLAERRSGPVSNSGARSVVLPVNISAVHRDAERLFWEYFEGILEGFANFPVPFELLSFDTASEEFARVRSVVEQEHVAGVLDFNLQSTTIDFLVAQNVPIVSLHTDFMNPDPRRTAVIYSDRIQGYFAAWNHLIANGHHHVGFIGWEASGKTVHYDECLAASKLLPKTPEFEKPVTVSETDTASIRRVLLEAMGPWKGGKWPSVFFCSNDALANHFLRALQEMRIEVPKQVSIVGFDDAPVSRWSSPTITSIRNPRSEIGMAMARMLQDAVAGRPGSRERTQVVPMTLVPRESVAKLNR